MSAISGVTGAGGTQMPAAVNLIKEGSMSEEARESRAEKAREQQRTAAKQAPEPAPSEKGEVGGGVNLMA
jgi:hypothetical protein